MRNCGATVEDLRCPRGERLTRGADRFESPGEDLEIATRSWSRAASRFHRRSN
jgi:hypothetical protein